MAVIGAALVSWKDFRLKNICPKVAGIPACYLVLLFFLATLVVHLGDINQPILYLAFLGVPTLLAFAGTGMELAGKKVCPRGANGLPMCFVSLAFCAALILLKVLPLYL